jgi:hypothetical protein
MSSESTPSQAEAPAERRTPGSRKTAESLDEQKRNGSEETGCAQDISDQRFAKRSTLYQEFLAERDEILKHKWIESEKKGEDIGFERALLDWIRKHRESWRKARKGASGKSA